LLIHHEIFLDPKWIWLPAAGPLDGLSDGSFRGAHQKQKDRHIEQVALTAFSKRAIPVRALERVTSLPRHDGSSYSENPRTGDL
jgi:hypothetical protein